MQVLELSITFAPILKGVALAQISFAGPKTQDPLSQPAEAS